MVIIKILVIGGTGFVGQELIPELLAKDHEIVVLTRNKEKAIKLFGENVQAVKWDDSFLILPSKEIEDIEVVINLAGESIGSGRWTNRRKEEILSSRIITTKAIVDAVKENVIKPKLVINSSAIGYYGPNNDEKLSEKDSPGNDFLAEVTKKWEEEANKAESLGVRVVTLRTGLVLGEGGALKQMLLPYKFYAGGSLGTGKQWVSWIHVKDLVEIINYVIENDHITGPVNGTAPNPVQMKTLSKTIGKVINKPAWFTVPSFVLRLVLGEMSDMLLNGQRVLPMKVSKAGYKFTYSTVDKALEDILKK